MCFTNSLHPASIVVAILTILYPIETLGQAHCTKSLPDWDAMSNVRLEKAPARPVNEQSVQVTREMASLFEGSTIYLALCIGEQLPTEVAYGFLPNKLTACLRSKLPSDSAKQKFDSCIPEKQAGQETRFLLDHEIAMLGLHILGEYQKLFDLNLDVSNFHRSRNYHFSMMRTIEAAWDEVLARKEILEGEAQELKDKRSRNSERMSDLRDEAKRVQSSGDPVDSLSQILDFAVRSVEAELKDDTQSALRQDYRFFGPSLDFLIMASLIQENMAENGDLYDQLIEAHRLVSTLAPPINLEASLDTADGRLKAYAERLRLGDHYENRSLDEIFSELSRLDGENFRLWEQLQPLEQRNEQFSKMLVWLQNYVLFVERQF